MDKETDLQALEAVYARALAHEKAGEPQQAAEAYREALTIDPDDCVGASVRLAALGLGPAPDKAPDAYVATLFDQHADVFESILVDQLEYQVPELMRAAADREGMGPFTRMLDLGCGSGLAGEAFSDVTDYRAGVDLSENMIAAADEMGGYDDLYVGEAGRFLEQTETEHWDLIVAADVLPYMGALEAFIALLADRTVAGGLVALSSETLPDAVFPASGWTVGKRQRFAHKAAYLRGLLEQHGLKVRVFDDITVRLEEGQAVPGHLVLAQKEG